MSDYFNLVEHRKAIARNTIRLSDDLVVIPMEQSNEDELRNQMRQLEARKMAKTVNRLLDEASTASEADRDDEALAKVTEATRLSHQGLDLMLSTVQTIVCTEDGKKPTKAQLKAAIGSQDECQAVMEVVARARAVDPTKLIRDESTLR